MGLLAAWLPALQASGTVQFWHMLYVLIRWVVCARVSTSCSFARHPKPWGSLQHSSALPRQPPLARQLAALSCLTNMLSLWLAEAVLHASPSVQLKPIWGALWCGLAYHNHTRTISGSRVLQRLACSAWPRPRSQSCPSFLGQYASFRLHASNLWGLSLPASRKTDKVRATRLVQMPCSSTGWQERVRATMKSLPCTAD